MKTFREYINENDSDSFVAVDWSGKGNVAVYGVKKSFLINLKKLAKDGNKKHLEKEINMITELPGVAKTTRKMNPEDAEFFIDMSDMMNSIKKWDNLK